jgi:transposase
MDNVTTISIDLAKSVFQVCALNKARKVIFNKQIKRHNLINQISQYPNATISMEACSSAHHWARTFAQMGLKVKLIPAQHVKAFVRGNKNDSNDALAIAEASFRPNLHTVQVKSIEQQDIQTLLRIRSRHKDTRKITVNQIRGLLAEYGIVIPKGIAHISKQLPAILEDGENGLTFTAREAIAELLQEHYHLTEKIIRADQKLKNIALDHPVAKSLMRLRGIGPITALALFACVGNAAQFKNARQLSAWLGLVPKQYGTGGKVHLSGISKRGNNQLRVLLIHGARTVMNWASKRDDQLSLWIKSLVDRRGKHKAMVALANKTARMVWVTLNKGVDALPEQYLASA